MKYITITVSVETFRNTDPKELEEIVVEALNGTAENTVMWIKAEENN